MVDLPSISNKLTVAKAPESKVTAAQISSPYLQLSESLDLASKEVGAFANRQAATEGLQAVTRDADGNVQVERPFIVGDAALHYQHGVETAAVAQGDSAIKDRLSEMRRKFENDPEGFRKAAEAFTKETVKQYQTAAGPRVGVTLGRIASNAAREFHEGLLNQKERRDIAIAKTSIEAQIESTKNEIFAIAAGGDTTSPAFVQRLQKIGALQGQLVNNPKFGVPKALAEYDMTRMQAELTVASFGHRVGEIQKEQGTEAALRAAENIRTDPGLNLTPTERFSMHSRLVGRIMDTQRAEQAISAQVSKEIDQVANVAAEGYKPPESQMAALRMRVGATDNPGLVAKLRDVEAIAPIVADWRKSSPAQLQQNLAELDATMRQHGATPTLIELKKTGLKLLDNMREGVKNDPLDWANRTGALPVQPINWQGDVPAQFRARAATAESVAAHYGRPPQYFTPDERIQISEVAKMGGAPMIGLAREMVDGFGPKAGKVLSEISKDAPVLAHIGGLMQVGGSPSFIRDAAEAVKIASDPQFKHPRWLTTESDAIQAAQNRVKVTEYGNAFLLAQESGANAVMTAQKAFFTRAIRNDYDPKLEQTSKAKEAYQQSLQEAAGARYDGGNRVSGGIDSYGTGIWFTPNRVLIPSNVRGGEFRTIINAIKDTDLTGTRGPDGKTYSASHIRNATPIATAGGYSFVIGDPLADRPKFIMSSGGQPFVLDLQRMEPELRKRVPSAYAD